MQKREILDALIEALDATLLALDENGFSVADWAQECDELPPQDAARVMAKLEYANELADTLKKTIGKVYDWSRMKLVPLAMESAGVDLLRVDGVGRVSLTADINLKVLNKDKQYTWLEEIGAPDIITETVNASTLKALIRRRMKAGEEVPDDIFSVTAFTRASITKS